MHTVSVVAHEQHTKEETTVASAAAIAAAATATIGGGARYKEAYMFLWRVPGKKYFTFKISCFVCVSGPSGYCGNIQLADLAGPDRHASSASG